MGFSLSKAFNSVKKYASNPMTWLTGGSNIGFDLLDKGASKAGLDLFGSGQQKINNQIAQENNQLQKEAFEFNKQLSTDTYNTNKDIAYNGSQIKSADMAKAGLNPLAGVNSSPQTVSSSSVQSPDLAQPDLVEQTGLQKLQTVAGLAMQAKQLQSSLSAAKVQSDYVKQQADYQKLVNDYFKKNDVLPTQNNEWVAQISALLNKKGVSAQLPSSESVVNLVQNIARKLPTIPSDYEGAFPIDKNPYSWNRFVSVAIGFSMNKFPRNEKGFLDWCKTNKGQKYVNKYGRSSLREFFFSKDSQ